MELLNSMGCHPNNQDTVDKWEECLLLLHHKGTCHKELHLLLRLPMIHLVGLVHHLLLEDRHKVSLQQLLLTPRQLQVVPRLHSWLHLPPHQRHKEMILSLAMVHHHQLNQRLRLLPMIHSRDTVPRHQHNQLLLRL